MQICFLEEYIEIKLVFETNLHQAREENQSQEFLFLPQTQTEDLVF